MNGDRIWNNDPTVKRWAQHVLDDMVPKADASSVCVTLVPTKGDSVGDVQYWVELGYMVCSDKPIMIVVMGDRPVPEHLERVADEIVRLPDGISPGASQELADAIKAFADRFPS